MPHIHHPARALRASTLAVISAHSVARTLISDLLRAGGHGPIEEFVDPALTSDQPKYAAILIDDAQLSCAIILEHVADLRSDPFHPNQKTPILALISNPSKDVIANARDAGITEILSKPFSAGALAKRMQSTLKSERTFVYGENYAGPNRRRVASAKRRADRRRLG